MPKSLFSLALTFIFTISTSVLASAASPGPTTLSSADNTNFKSQQTIKVPEGYELTPIGRYSSGLPVIDGMIAVLIGDLWGFVDATTGKEAVAPKYLSNGETLHFSDGMAKVYVKDKGFTFIDKTGKEIFPAGKYGEASDFVNGIAYIWKKDVGVGLIDKTGQEVVEPGTYNANLKNTDQFKENRIVVRKMDAENNKWITGVIDTTGKVVIPFGKYEFVDNFHDGLARASVGDFAKGRKFYIDINGNEVVSPENGPNNQYGFAEFSGGLAQFGYQVKTKVNERYGDVIVTGGYEKYLGYIDKTGQVVIPLTNKYNVNNNPANFVNGYAILWYGPTSTSMETDTNFTKQDIIDQTGKVILSTTAKGERFTNPSNGLVAKFYEMRYPDNTGMMIGGVNHERMWKVYNISTGENLIPDGYNATLDNFNPSKLFYAGDGDFPDGMIKLYKTEKVYPNGIACSSVINSEGKEIISGDKYAYIDLYSEKKVAVQDKSGSWGYLDINGNEIIAPQFDKATPFKGGKAVVGVSAGKDTAHPGVSKAPEFNYYILTKKGDLLDSASYVNESTTVSGGNQNINTIKASNVVRLAGENRYKTAIAISQSGWTQSDNVILVDGNNYPDALVGSSFAYLKNAPVLITPSDKLNSDISAEIARLGVKNIYILGNTTSVSQDIQNELSQKYNVARIGGTDVFDTAIKVGEEIRKTNKFDTVAITSQNGFADALAIAPFSARNTMPLLFSGKDNLRGDTLQALKDWNIKNVVIVGGTGVVSSVVEDNLKSMGITVTRLAGQDRYATALEIIKHFAPSEGYKSISICAGENFPDALTGAALAAKNNTPLVLVSKESVKDAMAQYINKNTLDKSYIFGGTGVVSDKVIGK